MTPEARMIHVCSLARLHDTVRDTGARHVVTLIKDISLVHRPASIAAENHLMLDMDDINDPIDGYVAPHEEHVGDLIRFVRAWDRGAPMVVSSRCGLSAHTVTNALRDASPTATPNLRIVRIADRMLGRDGRMVTAVEKIGTGRAAYATEPFRLDLE